jgi:hypothetical protein
MAAAAPAMNTGDWISAALALVQIAAIVIAALWAYYKFFRGRIFHKRAEPTVEGTLVCAGEAYGVRVKLALKNTGSSDIPLRVTLLTLAAHEVGDVDEKGHLRWREIARAHAFRSDDGEPDHVEIESQETITDEVLIPIGPDDTPDFDVFAYRIVCQVYERREGGGGICWTTKAIVPVEHATVAEPLITHWRFDSDESLQHVLPNQPTGPPDYPGPEVGQRPASEMETEKAERD